MARTELQPHRLPRETSPTAPPIEWLQKVFQEAAAAPVWKALSGGPSAEAAASIHAEAQAVLADITGSSTNELELLNLLRRHLQEDLPPPTEVEHQFHTEEVAGVMARAWINALYRGTKGGRQIELHPRALIPRDQSLKERLVRTLETLIIDTDGAQNIMTAVRATLFGDERARRIELPLGIWLELAQDGSVVAYLAD